MSKDFTRNDGSVCTLQKAGNHSLWYEVQKGEQVSWEVIETKPVPGRPGHYMAVDGSNDMAFRSKDSASDYFQILEAKLK